LLRDHIANPQERTAVVTHFRNRKLAEAWVRAGASPDGEVDKNEMTQDGGKPGSVSRMSYDPQVGIQFNDVDLDHGSGSLPGGVYRVRHGSTGWNKVHPTNQSAS